MLSDFISAAISELEQGLLYLAQTPGYHTEPGDKARMIGILSDLFELLYALDNPDGTPDKYAVALERAQQNWLASIKRSRAGHPEVLSPVNQLEGHADQAVGR